MFRGHSHAPAPASPLPASEQGFGVACAKPGGDLPGAALREQPLIAGLGLAFLRACTWGPRELKSRGGGRRAGGRAGATLGAAAVPGLPQTLPLLLAAPRAQEPVAGCAGLGSPSCRCSRAQRGAARGAERPPPLPRPLRVARVDLGRETREIASLVPSLSDRFFLGTKPPAGARCVSLVLPVPARRQR